MDNDQETLPQSEAEPHTDEEIQPDTAPPAADWWRNDDTDPREVQ